MPPRGRGHSRHLDRTRIVEAALELAREGGERALSMRRVAAALGVDPAALYWHFRNKDELLAEVARAAAEAVALDVPAVGSWQERTLTLCTAIHDQLRSHPELGLQVAGSPWTTPFNARANGLLVEVLAESGLVGPPLLYAAQGLLHEVTAIAQSQALAVESPPAKIQRYLRSVAEHLSGDAADVWLSLNREPLREGFDAYFAYIVGALVDGIALRAAPH